MEALTSMLHLNEAIRNGLKRIGHAEHTFELLFWKHSVKTLILLGMRKSANVIVDALQRLSANGPPTYSKTLTNMGNGVSAAPLYIKYLHHTD